jgi:phage terminase small subunit
MPTKPTHDRPKVIPLATHPTRLSAPANLTAPERAVFVELIAANPPEHFRASDLPLLASYCSAVVLHQRAVAELRLKPIVGGKSSPWTNLYEKSGRTMVALAMRLRLSPQSRNPNPTKRKATRLSIYEKMALQQPDDDNAADA